VIEEGRTRPAAAFAGPAGLPLHARAEGVRCEDARGAAVRDAFSSERCTAAPPSLPPMSGRRTTMSAVAHTLIPM
jgi:hypothetical protein